MKKINAVLGFVLAVCMAVSLSGCAQREINSVGASGAAKAAVSSDKDKKAGDYVFYSPSSIIYYKGGKKSTIETGSQNYNSIVKVIKNCGEPFFTEETKSIVEPSKLSKCDYIELKYDSAKIFPGKTDVIKYNKVYILLSGDQKGIADFVFTGSDGKTSGAAVTTMPENIAGNLLKVL